MEERHGRGTQTRLGTSGFGDRLINGLTQGGERSLQHYTEEDGGKKARVK